MKCTLLVIRHGETSWNKARRLQGHIDVPLNEQGRLQAQLLAQRLAREHEQEPIHGVYSSDLSRAYDTAQMIAQPLHLSVTTLSVLRERHYGILEGLTPQEIEQKHPKHFAAWHSRDPYHQFSIEPLVPPDQAAHSLQKNGESLVELNIRILNIFKELAFMHLQQKIVVVVHGGVLDIVHRMTTGQSLESPRNFPLGNASINQICFDAAAAQWTIENWGDIAHLPQSMDEVDSKVTYLQ